MAPQALPCYEKIGPWCNLLLSSTKKLRRADLGNDRGAYERAIGLYQLRALGMTLFSPYNRLKQCRHGMMLFNENDLYIGQSLNLYGEFSELEIDLFRRILKPGQTAIDVGANIGSHALPLSQIVAPGGEVYCFEPQRLIYQTLCANLALNSITNVHAYLGAVGAKTGSVAITELSPFQKNNFGGVAVGGNGSASVPLIPLDALGLRQCHLIKADVEGMELDVLKGARNLIKDHRPVLYLEADRLEKVGRLKEHIRRIGYNIYDHRPPLYVANNFRNNHDNVFGATVSMNLLCCFGDPPPVDYLTGPISH